MISNRIYGRKYALNELLQSFQYSKNFQTKAAAARIIYWDYSFNFGNQTLFSDNAKEFIANDGIQIMIRFACCHIYPHLHPNSCPVEFQRDNISGLMFAVQGTDQLYSRTFTLQDVQFQLPD